MHIKTLAAATLLLSALPAVSQARDTTLYLPFDQVVEAHRLMESSEHIGKIMLKVKA